MHVSSVEKSKSNARVIGTTLKKFLANGTLQLVAYDSSVVTRIIKRFGSCHCNESRPADEVIQTAKEYLSHPETWGSYNETVSTLQSIVRLRENLRHKWRDQSVDSSQ